MELASYQRLLKHLFMTREGHLVLHSEQVFHDYIDGLPVSDDDKACMKAQPFERWKQYEYMIQDNVDQLLKGIYIVTHQALADTWPDLNQAFFWEHPSGSYNLIQNTKPFPYFLEGQPGIQENAPFVPELALYEWTRAHLLHEPNVTLVSDSVFRPEVPRTLEELTQWVPVVNPIAVQYDFIYPVQEIMEFHWRNPEATIPWEQFPAKDTSLLLYRTASNNQWRHHKLSRFSACWLASLLEYADEDEASLPTYEESIKQALTDLGEPRQDPEALNRFFEGLLSTFPKLLELEILRGSLVRE